MTRNYKRDNKDRIRRARSWCGQGLKKGNSDEEVFLFLWIAFNAAYGIDKDFSGKRNPEWAKFKNFIHLVVCKDEDSKIKDYLSQIMSDGTGERLIRNKYIYEPFWWDWRAGKDMPESEFNEKNEEILDRWKRGEIDGLLAGLMGRLYMLRNQMIHGGITHGSGWGRRQVEEGRRVMEELVPLIIAVMAGDIEKNPDTDYWGTVAYPRFLPSPDTG